MVIVLQEKWRGDAVDYYLQCKRKRVISAYMDNHRITSLLRTFEIISRHKEECGSPVTISWLGGAGGYLGIVSNKGDVEVNHKFPIGRRTIEHTHPVLLVGSKIIHECNIQKL